MVGELSGQVATVTGGGRGIGRTIARMLAAEGVAVMVAARTKEELDETVALIEADGGQAAAVVADVSDRCAVEHMVAETERQFGPIDLLVNNAGVEGALGPPWEVDPDEWWRGVEINLRGTYLPTWAVLRGMVDRQRGRIVNVSTLSAFAPSPLSSSYACSKAAGVSLTESMGKATQRTGVKIFALNPGLVETAMTDYLMNSPEGKKWFPLYRLMGANYWIPAERAGEVVVRIASGKLDALSGRFIDVYDDLDEVAGRADEIQKSDLYTMRLRR